MTLKTSLVIGGDPQGATAALTAADAGLERLTQGAAEASAAGSNLGAGISAGARDAAAALGAIDGQLELVTAGARQAGTAGADLGTRIAGGAQGASMAVDQVAASMSRLTVATAQTHDATGRWSANGLVWIAGQTAATQKLTQVTGMQRAGMQQLTMQAGDMATMWSLNAPLAQIFASQIGQVAQAAQMALGGTSKVATFLAGPWGMAISAATIILVPFIGKLFESGDAARSAAADYSTAAEEAKKLVGAMNSVALAKRQIALNEKRDQAMEIELRMGRRPKNPDGTAMFSYRDQKDLEQLRWQIAQESNIIRVAEAENERLLRKTDKPSSRKKTGGGNTAAAAARRVEFGEDTAARIANIRDQFSDLPAAVEKSNKALRQLDDIASDVERRRPPNYAGLKSNLADARKAVEDSLVKPLNDYIAAARERAQIDQLLLQGREDEAEALRAILALEKQMGPLTQEQRDTILETAQAERQRAQALEKQQELINAYLDATRSVRSEIEAILAGQGKLSNFKQIFRQLQARALTEQLFGDALRGVEDYVKRNSFGPAVDQLSRETKRASEAIAQLAASATSGAAQIADGPSAGGGATGGATANNLTQQREIPETVDVTEIVVEATKPRRDTVGGLTPGSYFEEMMRRVTSPLTAALDELLGTNFFSRLQGVMSGAISGYLTAGPVGGILGALKEIPGLPKGISKELGKALEGAQTGTMTAGMMKMLGVKTSTTGAQIGGAIGSALPIPGGEIIGSILGGLVGGMFKKVKKGTATVGVVDGEGAITGTGGNSQSRIKAASGLASASIDSLDQIIDALGGQLGDFSGSIGVRKKKFVVDPSGQGRTKGSGVQKFATEAEASAALLADMIADGAVKGVSAAVQKALKSSADVDKAVKEALKVQEVELAIGGLGAQMDKAFKDFERQASERLRVAREYGFDIVKLEEQNGKDRLKLSGKLLEEQVGSLQSLIDEMTSGSLFEGSALDQRSAILDQIAKAKTAADAGEEGAADKLSGLYEQLNSVSKNAYGTTGGFASDRSMILDQARDTIAKANQRIADAQKATEKVSDPALAATNAALDENNDQNAQMISHLDGIKTAVIAARDNAANSGAVTGGGFARLFQLAGTSTK